MKTLDTLKSELDEYKKDYAHYQRLIPHAIEAKKKTLDEGRTLVANAIDHRIKFFNEKSAELKKMIEKRESEIQKLTGIHNTKIVLSDLTKTLVLNKPEVSHVNRI